MLGKTLIENSAWDPACLPRPRGVTAIGSINPLNAIIATIIWVSMMLITGLPPEVTPLTILCLKRRNCIVIQIQLEVPTLAVATVHSAPLRKRMCGSLFPQTHGVGVNASLVQVPFAPQEIVDRWVLLTYPGIHSILCKRLATIWIQRITQKTAVNCGYLV